MKRYAVFAYDQHDSLGGWDDLFGCFESIEGAKDTITRLPAEDFEFAHIVDLHQLKVTHRSYTDWHGVFGPWERAT